MGTNSSHCLSSRSNLIEGLSVSILIFVMIFSMVSRKGVDKWAYGLFLDQKSFARDIENVSPGIVPIVILTPTTYNMGSVVKTIKDLGAEHWHIPRGFTSLCQLVNVGFNKPLKDCIFEEWEDWMNHEGLVNGKAPTCNNVVHWNLDAYNAISNKIVRKAWRHGQYSWFGWGRGWSRRIRRIYNRRSSF